MSVRRWSDAPIDFDGRTSLSEWVESLPMFEGRRPMLTCNGYLNLLRHMLAGGEVPFYAEPIELLRDSLVAHQNETSELRRRSETDSAQAARWEPAIQRLWSLVYAADKRKTLRTDEVRAVLEAGRG